MTFVKGLAMGAVVVALLPIGLLSARAKHSLAPQKTTQAAPTAPSTDAPIPTPAMTEGFASIQLAAAVPVKAAAPGKATTASPPAKRHVLWRAPARTSAPRAVTAKPSMESSATPKMSDDNPYPRPAAPKMSDDRPFGVGS